MKPKVFIGRPVSKEVEAYIAKHCEYRIWDKKEPIPPEVLLEEAKKAEGLLVQKSAITEDFLAQASHLKVISNTAVGYDSFDLEAMEKYGVIGTHTPFVLDETVADLVFALMLSAARRIPELNNYVKQGDWNGETQAEELFGTDVHHTTLGIVGMGRIGEKIARRAVFGFNMKVMYNATTPKPQLEETYGMVYSDLDSLLEQSDFVVLIVPLTASTRKLIGAEQFKRMKSNAILINAARGAVVDEQALIEALQTGEIRGAALDVFEKEPTSPDNPLLKMDQVVVVPHIGSATAKTREAMVMKAAENLVAGVTGGVPENVVKELQGLISGQ
ncbi:2-hydroxyacid dehydrogenase [Planococcus salinus]|uniref:Glyoxylate/hydroxypyruvate reductase B n=1 Tax=Planococcus salinus TaxID=1848460 RepID=A0A3M8P5K6_9BACL|nr:D-glycerate dehydrogenase [Planococcus salinus]RNF38957.1 D-glycerate dehydrogenase [Planococcus salinus]